MSKYQAYVKSDAAYMSKKEVIFLEDWHISRQSNLFICYKTVKNLWCAGKIWSFI